MTTPRRRWSKTVIAFTLFSLLPIWWLVVLSLQPNSASQSGANLLPAPLSFQHYAFIASREDWTTGYLNATLYVLLNVAISLAVALPAAYAFSRYRFVGDRQAFFFIIVFRMIPPAIIMIPAVEMVSAAGMMDTHLAVAFAHALFTVPIAIWILEGFLRAVPREMEEAARADGYSAPALLLRIVLPQVRSGIAVAAFFCFVFSWAELVLANALTTVEAKPIGVVMKIVASPTGQVHTGIASAASVLMLIPGVAFAWALRRHLARGLSLGRVG